MRTRRKKDRHAKLKLRPVQHFPVIGIEGAYVYYGPNKNCDFLNFGSHVSRIGLMQSNTFVKTYSGDVFCIMATQDPRVPWVFDKVTWL